MELRVPHMLHLLNVFCENDGKENCAQLIEEEFNRIFGINDEHDCNVVSMTMIRLRHIYFSKHFCPCFAL